MRGNLLNMARERIDFSVNITRSEHNNPIVEIHSDAHSGTLTKKRKLISNTINWSINLFDLRWILRLQSPSTRVVGAPPSYCKIGIGLRMRALQRTMCGLNCNPHSPNSFWIYTFKIKAWWNLLQITKKKRKKLASWLSANFFTAIHETHHALVRHYASNASYILHQIAVFPEQQNL